MLQTVRQNYTAPRIKAGDDEAQDDRQITPLLQQGVSIMLQKSREARAPVSHTCC